MEAIFHGISMLLLRPGDALMLHWMNTLRPRQYGRNFADDIFKWIFLNENVWIPIKISLKFVPQGPINNIQALVEIMAWRRPGDKPLSGPMVVRLQEALTWSTVDVLSMGYLSDNPLKCILVLENASEYVFNMEPILLDPRYSQCQTSKCSFLLLHLSF